MEQGDYYCYTKFQKINAICISVEKNQDTDF